MNLLKKPDPHAVFEQLLDHARGTWRFRWHGLAVAWVIAIGVWAWTFMLPDSYQASARVFLDTNTALSEVTRGISVQTDITTQIQRVRQTLLGGPQLEKVAQQTDLMSSATTPRERQAVVDGLRRKIEISGSQNAAASIYVISYQHNNREVALKVVDRLLRTFVEGTLVGKREGTEQAQQFLINEIHDLEKRLGDAEQKLAEFKKKNFGLMPGAQGDYFARLQAATAELEKAQSALTLAIRRRDDLGRQMRGQQAYSPGPPAASAGAGNGVAVVGTDLGARIRETQARLDEMSLKYTERHPDVQALKATLQELKQRQYEELEAARGGDSAAADRIGLTANPVYQSLQLQLNQAEVAVGTAQTEFADRQRKVAELRQAVNAAPEVEAELTRLNRDYEVTRAQYQALVERLERSRLGESAQATGVVQFDIIDPPSAKYDPVAPNRPLLIVLGLLAGLGAGSLVAYVLHLLRPVFGTARELNAATGLPVLGVVSRAGIDTYVAERRRLLLAFSGAAAALLVTAGLVIALQRPIAAVLRSIA